MKYLYLLLLLTACGGTPSASLYYPVPGPQGNQGPAGANGSVVTAIQFCPNVYTNYPNTFPEFGLCINGILYATYWDGSNAWTAEIPAGVYKSTSTSAPCDFTVVTDCGIVNN